MVPEQINLALFYIVVLSFELSLWHMEPELLNFLQNQCIVMYLHVLLELVFCMTVCVLYNNEQCCSLSALLLCVLGRNFCRQKLNFLLI
jgi:hypothetical protein